VQSSLRPITFPVWEVNRLTVLVSRSFLVSVSICESQAWIVFFGVRSGGGTLTLEEYENLSPDAFDDFCISNATISTLIWCHVAQK